MEKVNEGEEVKIGAQICAYNEEEYLGYCLRGIYDHVDCITVLMNMGITWGGTPITRMDRTAEIALNFPDPDNKIQVIGGEWESQEEQRNYGLKILRKMGYDYIFVVDADEFYRQEDLERLRELVETQKPKIVQVDVVTFWRSFYYRIKLGKVHMNVRGKRVLKEHGKFTVFYRIAPWMKFGRGRGIGTKEARDRLKPLKPRISLYHTSHVRTVAKMRAKLKSRSSSRKIEDINGYFRNKWLAWDDSRHIGDLHPLSPPRWKRAEKVFPGDLPEVLEDHPYLRVEVVR